MLVHVRIASQGIRSDCIPAKGCAFPNTSGAFHRWNRMAEGIAPWATRQDLSRYATVFPVLQRRASTPFLPIVLARS